AISAKEQGLCDAHNQQMLALIKSTRSIRTVVLASYSTDYIYGTDKSSPDYYSGTIKLIEDLHALGIKVKLLGDVPMTGPDVTHRVDIPDCLAKHLDSPDQCDNPRSLALATKSLRNAINRSAAKGDVTIIDTSSQFCDRTECYALIGGVPVFFDSS